MDLTEKDEKFLREVQAEMAFFEKHKELMRDIKTVFLNKGPDEARNYIKSRADDLLAIACDELFWSLFHKL